MKCLNILFILLLCCAAVRAQNEFLVYTLKGNVTITEDKTPVKAKIGKLLLPTAQVTVPADGAVTLICNQASLITLKPGKHQLSDLAGQCKPSGQSVSSNYLKFVWSQLTTKEGIPEKNRKYFMGNVGAVSRGNVNNIWIDPRLDTVNYYTGSFPLTWKSYADAEEFYFSVYGSPSEANPLYYQNTRKHNTDIREFARKLEPGKMYYWTSAVRGEQNKERKVLHLYREEEYQDLLTRFNESAPEYESESAKAFRLAFMLEHARFLAEAFALYKKAAELDPATVLYKTTLEAFKKDYNITGKG